MIHREEVVTFGSRSGAALHGTLSLPTGTPRAAALFAHCFTCDSRSHAATRISRALADRGWAVLRFDFTGLGRSEGDFGDTTFRTNIADLVDAAGFLAERFGGPQLLIGHSLGGAAALAAAPEIADVEAVVTIGAPADPAHVLHLFSPLPQDGATAGRVRVNIGGRPFEVSTSMIDELRAFVAAETGINQGRALLVIHAPTDMIVGIDNAREIYERARHPKSFVSLDGADHLLSNPTDAQYVADVVTAWASRHLAPSVRDGDADVEEASPSTIVSEDAPDGFTQTARVRGHRWIVDEPAEVGGSDRGPTPYELMLSALGACTAMTLRMYGNRKGWVFGRTRVELQHDRIHATDCAECETTSGRVDRITRTITLDPALSAEQRAALLDIADRCPVHRTLTNELTVQTRLADPV